MSNEPVSYEQRRQEYLDAARAAGLASEAWLEARAAGIPSRAVEDATNDAVKVLTRARKKLDRTRARIEKNNPPT